MPSWLLLVFVLVVWCLWVMACAAQRDVEDARRGLAEGQRRGVSFLPVMPVFPLLLWGAACLLDGIADPWGTLIVGSLHAMFAVILVASIVRDWRRLRSLTKGA